MNPDQLWETTLCPDTRRLVPFQADRETIKQMTATFTLLMGKGEAAGRRACEAAPVFVPVLTGNFRLR